MGLTLTDTQIRQSKPREKPYKLADGGGLFLLVTPSGGRWWRWKFSFAGKEKQLSLGTYPETTLKSARAKHDAGRLLLSAGKDPSQHRKDEKHDSANRRENNFAAWANAWYSHKLRGWAPASAIKARSYLDSDLIPGLGLRPMTEIKRTELVALLAKIEKRGAYNVAKKCRGWLSGIFRYSMAAGVIESNPATDLSIVAARAPKTRHHPHLPISELPQLLKALVEYRGAFSIRYAIELLLLTASRPGELRLAAWSEFDFDTATWSIPAERMKMRRPHVVPLPVQAVALLNELQKFNGGRELVFASPYKPRQAVSDNTLNKALASMGYKDRQTAHGFRHLISTALNEADYNPNWIEAQLAHGDKNAVRATYNKAIYLDQRRKMMSEWADRIDTLRAS